VTDKGIIEIGNSKIEATQEEIRILKSILDNLYIYHIIDDVVFFSPFDAAIRMKAIHNVKVWKVERDGSVSRNNRFGHSGCFEYRKLVIPDLYEFNFINLLLLDNEEADFIGDLVYRSE